MSKVIGIDLGTTNSCVAVMEGSDVVVIPNSEGGRTTPSVVSFTKTGDRLVGQVAKRQAVTNPYRTIQSIKREMGSNYKVSIDNISYTPQEISAMILSKLKSDAEAYLGTSVTQAVISVPAYFTDSQRQATKDAGRIAGLDVLRIINEPTAASLAYGLDKESRHKILVFDLGGGTFDVSILDISNGVFEVLSVAGNNKLGGDDFDNKIIDYLVDTFKHTERIDLRSDKMAMQRLREAAEKAKIELSSVESSDINLPYITADAFGPKHLDITLTRDKFDRLTVDLIQNTLKPIDRALKDAGISPSNIDKILLVGGSSRIPAVQNAVRNYFGREPFRGINPDECVAIGAAIQAAILTGVVKGRLLLDVTPLSLGIETMGGVFTKVIERNTSIPTKKTMIFSTAADGQTQVDVHVLQGEHEKASYNQSLGNFILDGIVPAPKGVPQIEVTFDIDGNGIVNVTAKDKVTGKNQGITVQSSSNMSEKDIQRAINETKNYKSSDNTIMQNSKSIFQSRLINSNLPLVTEYDDRFDKASFEEVINATSQGDVAAIYELGSRYRLGVDGAEKNEVKAIGLYKEVLKHQNNCDAFYHIGFMLAGGTLGEQHENECLPYYAAACEMGSSRAATQLGILYEYGTSYLGQNLERAIDYYDKAIQLGNGNGLERTNKARLLEQLGKNDLAKQCYYETIQYYNNEIQNGKTEDAAWCLGEMGNIYQHLGEELKAKQCYELAVRSGKNPQAATDLGTIYEDGIPGVLEPDLEKALYYYRLGYDTKYDDDRAVLNIHLLAMFYFHDKAGEGKDFEAFKLFKEIYDMGSNVANAYLGYYYGTGISGHIEVNINKAFELLGNVEKNDEDLALYYKGVIYLKELHDPDSAKIFLAQATALGNLQAKELLDKIDRRRNPLAETITKAADIIKTSPLHEELVQLINKEPDPSVMVSYTKRIMSEGNLTAAFVLISGTYHVYPQNLAVIAELITIDDIYLYGKYATNQAFTKNDKNACDMVLGLINQLRTMSYGDPISLNVAESNMYFNLGKYYSEIDRDTSLHMYAKSNIDYTPRAAVEIFGVHTMDIDKYITELYFDSVNLKRSLNSSRWHEDRFKALAYFALETIYVNGAPQVPSDMAYAYWCIEQANLLNPGNSVYEEEKRKFRRNPATGKLEYLP